MKTPNVLLLDEPLSNLDARLRLQTREEIRKIQQETRVTTVFVTHDQEEAMSISDQIVVMKDGIFMQMGRPQEVYDDPASLFVAKFLGNPPINVFKGEVRKETLWLGDQPVLSVKGVPDQPVTVGILSLIHIFGCVFFKEGRAHFIQWFADTKASDCLLYTSRCV